MLLHVIRLNDRRIASSVSNSLTDLLLPLQVVWFPTSESVRAKRKVNAEQTLLGKIKNLILFHHDLCGAIKTDRGTDRTIKNAHANISSYENIYSLQVVENERLIQVHVTMHPVDGNSEAGIASLIDYNESHGRSRATAFHKP